MKSAFQQVTWSGVASKTLTDSYVASDEIKINFANRMTIYPYYTAGAAESGNTMDFVIEANPLTSTEDPTGAYWGQAAGQYTNSSGTYSEEAATYRVAQGAASTMRAGEPLEVLYPAYDRIRLKFKENGVASNYGTVRCIIVKSDNI